MTTSGGIRRCSSTGTSDSRLGTYDRSECLRMPDPTKQVSAVTPSRSGMPGGALSAWIVYVSLFSSSARTPAHGTATFPETTTRGLPGREAKRTA